MDMLFVRDFGGFSGGHLKFADYIGHTRLSGLANPVLYQTPRSREVPGNIFNYDEVRKIDDLRPFPAYFVAGKDWLILERGGIDPGAAPVVNLIQDFNYLDPRTVLRRFLKRPALRICVSESLAAAVRPYANGEVHFIENGIDVGLKKQTRPIGHQARVFIAGFKNPTYAEAIAVRLAGIVDAETQIAHLPRPEFLVRLAEATISVFLPFPEEGFFLPPLEAMALGCGVVTPDCRGNRAYCRPGENCLMPPYDVDALADAVLELLQCPQQLHRLLVGGLRTAAAHSVERERIAYQALLTRYLGSLS